MDFSLSEEQTLLQDSLTRYVRDHCDLDRHRSLVKTSPGYDLASWRQFGELGWLSLPFSEELDGFGGGAVDMMVACEALGKGVVREPFLSTVVVCGGFLRRGASSEQQAAFIPGIMDGSKCWAFAFAETGSGYDQATVGLEAVAHNGSYHLRGSKIAVLDGDSADYLIVSARTAGSGRSRDGLSLFVVDANQAGVARAGFSRADGGWGANIEFDNCIVSEGNMLGSPGQGLALIEAVIDESIIAMGAEALGIMQVLLDATVEYTKTRHQFGQAIGKFQALQHRMADMYLKLEETRSLVLNAAIRMDEGSSETAAACAALKVKLAEAGKFISQQAIQLHGGIGMTDELVVSHHFKRLMLLAMLFGDEDFHLQRYIELTRRAA